MLGVLALISACSADEDRSAVRTAMDASLTVQPQRWKFLDAFAALRDRDPAKRLAAVDWIGRNLGAHRSLALDALRAAAADDAPEVAARARELLFAIAGR